MTEKIEQASAGVASVLNAELGIYAIERLENGKWVERVCFKDYKQKALNYFKHWTGINTRLKNKLTFDVIKTNEVIL